MPAVLGQVHHVGSTDLADADGRSHLLEPVEDQPDIR